MLPCNQELAGRVAELETENRKMKQELEEYSSEAAHLRNQQATVRRLEERNRLLEQQVSVTQDTRSPSSTSSSFVLGLFSLVNSP